MQYLILCGGLGTRLSKKYINTPKAIIKFDKKENLGLLVKNLKKFNRKICISNLLQF